MDYLQWMESALELPRDLTVWQFLNSQFLATFVGAIVAVLVARFGSKAAEAVSDAAASQGAESAVAQARDIEESMPLEVQDTSVGTRDYREEARSLIQQGKEYLDAKASSDPDGRHRRTYEAINRYDYVPLAVALNVRNQISAQQLAGAASLFSRWKAYGRGRAANNRVPESVYNEMRESLAILQG